MPIYTTQSNDTKALRELAIANTALDVAEASLATAISDLDTAEAALVVEQTKMTNVAAALNISFDGSYAVTLGAEPTWV